MSPSSTSPLFLAIKLLLFVLVYHHHTGPRLVLAQQQPPPPPPLPPPQSPQPLTRSPCPRAIKINTNYQFRNTLHFICLQATHSRPRLDVIQYLDQQVILSREVDEFGANQLESFVDNDGTLRILLAVPNRLNGTSMYSVDPSGAFIEETHTINTQHVSAMSIWKLELNWEWQLAIANQPIYDPLIVQNATSYGRHPFPELRPMITIHSWRSTYFDSYQRIDLPLDGRVNKLQPMHINDQEFIIVAMESQRYDSRQMSGPRAMSGSADSLIYRLDIGDGTLNWEHYQNLNTQLAVDISSFAITHGGSLQKDYYIALLGQLKPKASSYENRLPGRHNATAESTDYGLIIYKYFGDQFVTTHSIPALGATKLDTISYGVGDSYVIIALLSEWSNQIILYWFDGLTLKLVPGPQSNGAPPALSRQPSDRHAKRGMTSTSLHLFMLPQTSINETNDSSIKRTLGDEQQQMTMPALAFTSPVLNSKIDNSDDDMSPPNNETLYQIPVNELITNVVESPVLNSSDEGRTKKSFINTGYDLLGWCKATINNLLLDNFDSSSKQLMTLPRVDQNRPIELNGDLIIEGNLHVTNLLYSNNIREKIEKQYVIIEQAPSNFSSTFNDIQLAHAEIDLIKSKVDQILVDDGSVQDVFQPLKFDTLVIECLHPINMNPRLQHLHLMGMPVCPYVGEIRTIHLNSRDISSIQNQALLTGRSMTIARDVRFEHLVLRGQVQIADTLNGIHIDNIVFTQPQTNIPIDGHKNFINGLYSTSNLIVDDWNGRKINRQNVLTSSGEQRIGSNIRFSHVVLDSLPDHKRQNVSSRFETINGLFLDSHLNQIALSDANNNFDLPVHFEELILNGPIHFSAQSRLSGFNIEELWANTMFKHSHQNVTAPMQFIGDVHVSYGGDVVVNGPINGVFLGPSSLLMRNLDYELPNPIIFDGDVSIRDLHLEKALNGIQVVINGETQKYELAILYDGGNQFITGDKLLNEIYLGGNSIITGNINGHLDLNQLYSLANNNGAPFRFSTVRVTGQNIRIADNVNINIDSMINGVPTNDICSVAIRAAQSTSVQYSRLKFDQPITFRSLKCGAINGFNDIAKSFLTRHGNQHVAGTIKLANGVIFNTTINIGSTLNNLNVAPLSRAIAQAVEETRTRHKELFEDLFVDDLVVDRINDLLVSNIFLAKSDIPQVVRAPMIFDHLDIENVLIVGQNLITHSFNGLNISDIISNTLQYDAHQVIYNHVELQTLQLLSDSDFMTKSLNGHDLRRLYSDAVLVDAPQQIIAPKTFQGSVEFLDRVYLRYGIDGLSENELRFNLLLHGDELIDHDLEFNNDVTVKKELEIQSGMINDIDINQFVDSMLYENRPDRVGLRINGNGSVRFRDVKVNNLVVAGTIQGLDLSKEALLLSDNINGSYNSQMREQQIYINNQRILNSLHNTNSPFQVSTNYRGENLVGNCFVHSCPRTTPIITPYTPPYVGTTPKPNVPIPSRHNLVLPNLTPIAPINRPYVVPTPRMPSRPPQPPQSPLLPVVLQTLTPTMPRPMSLINNSAIVTTWRPNWEVIQQPFVFRTNHTQYKQIDEQTQLIDPKYFEHRSMLQAQAIQELSYKVNKYLSISFYYEIAQKHPLLGPLLHAASSPIMNEESSALLVLKATSKLGEPCLQRGQTIAVMAQYRHRNSISSFTINSRIQETSNPYIVGSLVANKIHYLFILDSYLEGSVETLSQVLVYFWDYKSGRYELRERKVIDGFPTAMKAFVVNNLACFALANPRVMQGNHSGSPTLHCQQAPLSDFSHRIVLPISNVFDLDVVTLPPSMRVVIATLSQQDTEQIGDLNINSYDIMSKSVQPIAMYRLVRPLKLHFIERPQRASAVQLAVSEAITSNNDAQAITRLFSLRFEPTYASPATIYESQIIKDNQFYDIQSVLLDNTHPMLFLQSAHAISIYAPVNANRDRDTYNSPHCDGQFSLVQRLPTKGANKFLVFNDNIQANNRSAGAQPLGHYLVLSKDDCEHQQYSTLILKAKFN